MATDKPRFTITLNHETLDMVNDYKISNHISTQSRAIQELVDKGIRDMRESGKDTPRIKTPDSVLDLDGLAEKHNVSDLERKIIRAYFTLPEDLRLAVVEHFKNSIYDVKPRKKGKRAVYGRDKEGARGIVGFADESDPTVKMTRNDYHAELDRQLDAEKKVEDESSGSGQSGSGAKEA